MIVKVGAMNWNTEVLDSQIPVLIKFGAKWCAPCRTMDKTLTKLAAHLKDKFKFVDIDIDEEQDLALMNKVNSVPYSLIVKKGRVIETINGVMSEYDITKKLYKIERLEVD